MSVAMLVEVVEVVGEVELVVVIAEATEVVTTQSWHLATVLFGLLLREQVASKILRTAAGSNRMAS